MAGFERTVTIARPLAEVWDFFADHSNVQAWMPDIVRLEQLGDGPVGRGTKFNETRKVGKREHTATLEITEFEPRSRYAGTVDQMGVRGTYLYEFEDRDGGTRVHLTATVETRGLMKLMTRFVVKSMEKLDGDHLDRLKTALESAA